MTKKRPSTPHVETSLDQLCRGQSGVITCLEGDESIVCRMMEMGLIEEAHVEIVHEAPFGKDPLAIRVRGGLLALRRNEAKLISVRKAQDT